MATRLRRSMRSSILVLAGLATSGAPAAGEPPPAGHWALAKTEVNIPAMVAPLEPDVSWAGDAGRVTLSKSMFIDPARKDKQTLAGRYEWDAPPAALTPGQRLELTLHATMLTNTHPNGGQHWAAEAWAQFFSRGPRLGDAAKKEILSLRNQPAMVPNILSCTTGSKAIRLLGEVPPGDAAGTRDVEGRKHLDLVVAVKWGNHVKHYTYLYAWKPGTPPPAPPGTTTAGTAAPPAPPGTTTTGTAAPPTPPGTTTTGTAAPPAATPWVTTPDGYPDVSGAWTDGSQGSLKIEQAAGGRVTIEWTHGVGAGAGRSIWTGTITKAGRLAAERIQGQGDTPTGSGPRLDHDLQLSPDGRSFAGAATGESGRTSVTWTRKGASTTDAPAEPASTAAFTLQAGRRQGRRGDLVDVPIYLLNPGGVGNLNVVVTYARDVALAKGKVARGNVLGNTLFESNLGEPGQVRIGVAGSKPLGASGILAHVPFELIGKPGDRCELTVSVTSANAIDGRPLIAATIPGALVVLDETGSLPGDGDGDGALTAGDALAALRMSVRLVPEKRACDLDGDGAVTSNDARLILQKVVGK